MSNPIVLITGALTGIGRATALAFARDGASSWLRGAGTTSELRWSQSSGRLVWRLNSSTLIYDTKATSHLDR